MLNTANGRIVHRSFNFMLDSLYWTTNEPHSKFLNIIYFLIVLQYARLYISNITTYISHYLLFFFLFLLARFTWKFHEFQWNIKTKLMQVQPSLESNPVKLMAYMVKIVMSRVETQMYCWKFWFVKPKCIIPTQPNT